MDDTLPFPQMLSRKKLIPTLKTINFHRSFGSAETQCIILPDSIFMGTNKITASGRDLPSSNLRKLICKIAKLSGKYGQEGKK